MARTCENLSARKKSLTFLKREESGSRSVVTVPRIRTYQTLLVQELGFRVSSFGCRVSGVGFRVSAAGFRLSGFGFRFSKSGFRVSGFGFRIPGFGLRVSGFGFRVPGYNFRVSGFGFRVSGSRFTGQRSQRARRCSGALHSKVVLRL